MKKNKVEKKSQEEGQREEWERAYLLKKRNENLQNLIEKELIIKSKPKRS